MLGTIKRKRIHQIEITIERIMDNIYIRNKIQLRRITVKPKRIIDQGWHQNGFDFQKRLFVISKGYT